MYSQMLTSLSGMRTSFMKMNAISDNIANVNTDSFKGREASFESILTQEFQTQPKDAIGERITPKHLRVGQGSKLGLTRVDTSVGAPRVTSKETDLYINNESYFQVQREGVGALLTRRGDFQETYNEDGARTLKTAEGDAILDDTGNEIVIPEGYDFSILRNGQVEFRSQSEPADIVLGGRIPTYSVPNRQQLLELDSSYYVADPENMVETPANEVDLLSGHLEQSNTNLNEEMIKMIETQRAFQMNSRALSFADQMNDVINKIGK